MTGRPKIHHPLHVVAGPNLPPGRQARVLAATEAVARAINRLDADLLRPWLAEDVRYESQAVAEPMFGADAVTRLLRRKYDTVRAAGADAQPVAELGVVDLPRAAGHPCAILSQHGKQAALFVIELDGAGRIAAIDILTAIPHPSAARSLGITPK